MINKAVHNSGFLLPGRQITLEGVHADQFFQG